MSNYDSTETTMVPGTLRGYRAWRIKPWGLQSVSMTGHTWGKTEQARCLQGGVSGRLGHSAPKRGCSCGIYAKHTLDDLEYEFGTLSGYMYGSIKVHGRIMLGDHGFRAQHAEIEALLWRGLPLRYEDKGLTGILNSVPFYTDRAEFLNDYPPISVDHLLPEKAPNPWVGDPGDPINLDALQLYLDQMQLKRDQQNSYMLYRMTRNMMGY